MPVTLKDIAERVGKSIPTVSRALGDFDDVSPETRREVRRVAEEMGYEPNVAARNLQKQRTDTIALILPTTQNLRFSDPFFSVFLSGIVEQTASHGFDLSVSMEFSHDERQIYLRHVRSRRVDGFIIIRTQREDSRIDFLRQHNMPFVAFGRTEQDNDFHLIDEDGTYAIRQVVDHLVALGHTRMAYITEPTRFTKAFHRLQGYLEGLHDHELPYDPELVVEASFRQRSGRLAAFQLLDLPDPPTAIIACNDLLALGAMSAARERGLEVGRDVSITGFDDIPMAEFSNPPLTTVHQPAHQYGTMVVQMLIGVIRQTPMEQKQVILQPSLVVRQTSGPR